MSIFKAKEFAKTLTDRNYGFELTKEEEQYAKDNNLVVVFGRSDDCLEIRGAIDDELGMDAHFTKDGLLEYDDDFGSMEEMINFIQGHVPEFKVFKIEGTFEDREFPWMFETKIDHATFEIYEDGEKSCLGLVFTLDSLESIK